MEVITKQDQDTLDSDQLQMFQQSRLFRNYKYYPVIYNIQAPWYVVKCVIISQLRELRHQFITSFNFCDFIILCISRNQNKRRLIPSLQNYNQNKGKSLKIYDIGSISQKPIQTAIINGRTLSFLFFFEKYYKFLYYEENIKTLKFVL
ncbi:Hypothetical_protein [Hexamita inflata]|uniref:Hypothetical_protein n=1 Tax=Hexamita inflata TaxID=28002 RepID=A0AA86QHW6_9EUKA|nr:Hypothetical protein HINF_LOCUS46243 [Hexamita inflata]